jgi:adenylate cyclase
MPDIPMDEAERQQAVDDLRLIATPQEERFDRIVNLAQLLFRVPIAYIALIDKDRQWFKSKVGLKSSETARDISFCGHAILQDAAMVVPDALQDYRFAGNPMVQGDPFIRFYVGQPLRGPSGHKVGTLCLADREPRDMSEHDLKMLAQLARLVEREFTLLDQIQMQIENLKAKEEIERKSQELEQAVEALSHEKEHSELLLKNIFPGEVADELKQNGRVKAVAHDKVSVLFADFSSFTSVASTYSPSELLEELNRCFCLFDGLCGRHGVEKLKTIGDGYLCVSGLHGDPADGGLRLLRFAQEAMDFILKRKAEVESTGRKYWSMRIGIHCGPAVSGVVGVKRMAFDMWGDTVNAAARMEQTSEPGRINLSISFSDMLAGKISTTCRGVLPIKNCGEMKMCFFEKFTE